MTMHWAVAAPYFDRADDQWISDAAPASDHSFQIVPRFGVDRNWHQASARTNLTEWLNRARQSIRACGTEADGIITVFPQLAAVTGAVKTVRRDRRPQVAWMFNTEGFGPRRRRVVARRILRNVDRFVVHSRAEIALYAKTLGLPEDRFTFVPLQYGGFVETEAPAGIGEQPYVFATGSGHRDYETFFTAMAKLGYPTLVLASDRALAGLTPPPNVEIIDQLSRPEIRRLVRHARVNVVPLNDEGPTAGLITIVETFRHGRSLVVTERPGLDDYCRPGETVLGAGLYDAASLAESIDAMWSESSERQRLDAAADAFAQANCTDEAVATHLIRILDEVAAARS